MKESYEDLEKRAHCAQWDFDDVLRMHHELMSDKWSKGLYIEELEADVKKYKAISSKNVDMRLHKEDQMNRIATITEEIFR